MTTKFKDYIVETTKVVYGMGPGDFTRKTDMSWIYIPEKGLLWNDSRGHRIMLNKKEMAYPDSYPYHAAQAWIDKKTDFLSHYSLFALYMNRISIGDDHEKFVRGRITSDKKTIAIMTFYASSGMGEKRFDRLAEKAIDLIYRYII
jgi:hypothetical protein